MSHPLELLPLACFELQSIGGHGELSCTALNAEARALLCLEANATEQQWLASFDRLLAAEERNRFRQEWQVARQEQRALHWQGQLVSNAAHPWLRVELAPDQQGNWQGALIPFDQPPASNSFAQLALDVTAAIPVGTYVLELDAQGRANFRFASERWLQMLQLRREEVLADPSLAFERVHPDDLANFQALNAAVFASGEEFFWEGRIVVDHEIRWVSIESIPRKLSNGCTIWEGVMIDITERVKAQQQLQRSREQLERVLDNIPVALAINKLETDDPEITFLNKHFTDSLCYTRSELSRISDWARLAYPDPEYREEVFCNWNAAMTRAAISQGTVEQGEYRVRSGDGRTLRLLISAVVLNDMALVAMLDVTRTREAELQLVEALKRERAQEEQLRIRMEEKLRVSLSASAVAHEISQPLSVILMNSHIAMNHLESSQTDLAFLRQLMISIASEAQRMDQITDRIRMLLRQVDTRRVPLDLREVVHSAALQLNPALQQSSVDFLCDLPSEPCELAGDPVQLQLAILNLLRNGLDALQDAPPQRQRPQLQLQLRRHNSYLELTVSDNGPGFPSQLDLQVPLSTTKISGSGIGLYVVRLTIENHGGRLNIGRSPRLGGAEVTISLPADLSQNRP